MCPSSDAAHEILSLKLIEVASGSFERRGLGANLESLVGFFKKGQASQAGGGGRAAVLVTVPVGK